jgi:hypothetical protein
VSIVERFDGRLDPRWRLCVTGGGVQALGDAGLRLGLTGAAAGGLGVAQLDEGPPSRAAGDWRPSVRLRVRARWSHPADALIGTSGFGFWNDPVGPGGFTRPPAWVWFAHYSPPSHVAFGAHGPGHGPRGAALSAPAVGRVGLTLGNLALRLPGVGKLAVGAAGRMARGGDLALTTSLTDWRDYELTWRSEGVTFAVDGAPLGRVGGAPPGPLGFVAWMDNQWAALRPDGRAAGGYLAVAGPQWLEIARIEIAPGE